MKIRNLSYYSPLLALLLLAFSSGTIAAPKVVVSIPPLHSLVSGLMTGVSEPVLLIDSDKIDKGKLTATQKLQLISADMIIWVGAGLEKQIASTVQNEMPAIDRNMYALSNHLPLLPKSSNTPVQLLLPQERQQYSDLNFWADPKLAAMAVRHITPKLVRLDPDNAETYLDNEIKLLARIKKMGQHLAETLAPYQGMLDRNQTVPTYLAWRYGIKKDRLTALASVDHTPGMITECHFMVKVGGTQQDNNASDVYGSNLAPGAELYFQMMQRQARSITACGQESKSIAGTATHKDAHI